jgi:hypothetical protein
MLHKIELFITTAVNLKLSLCLINLPPRHEGVWRSGGRIPLFLNLTLNEGEWSASNPSRFTPEKKPTVPIG